MKEHLSSHLTVFLKIVFPIVWSLMIIGITIYILVDSQDMRTLFVLLALLLVWGPIQLKQVTYDDNYVYIYNWRTTKTYALTDIKGINEGHVMTFDQFFELEILEKTGQVQKVDFMPHVSEHLHFTFTGEYTRHLLDFRTKITNQKIAAQGSMAT